jgi:hypothetical protein
MARLFKLTIELCPVTHDSSELEFRVRERIRTAQERPVCTLQVGEEMTMDAIATLQQIIDDCVLSAVGRTVGSQERLSL